MRDVLLYISKVMDVYNTLKHSLRFDFGPLCPTFALFVWYFAMHILSGDWDCMEGVT